MKKAVEMHCSRRPSTCPDPRRGDITDRLRAGERLSRAPGWEPVAVMVLEKANERLRWLAADEADAEFRSIVEWNGLR